MQKRQRVDSALQSFVEWLKKDGEVSLDCLRFERGEYGLTVYASKDVPAGSRCSILAASLFSF
jgi:hypothetical protein